MTPSPDQPGSAPPEPWRLYLRLVLALLALPCALVATANFLSDPLWCFGAHGTWNLAQHRIDERIQKTNRMVYEGVDGDILVLGSSRMTFLKPDDFAGRTHFNLAFSKASPREFTPFAAFARAHKGREFVAMLIGLDFFGADGAVDPKYKAPEAYFADSSRAFYRVGILLGHDTLKYAWQNLRMSRRLARGKRVTKIYYRPDRAKVHQTYDAPGAVRAFEGNLREYTRRYGPTFRYDPGYKATLVALRDQHPGCKMVPVLTPEHDAFLQMEVAQGRLPDMKRWMRDVVEVFGAAYDFTGPNAVTRDRASFVDGHHPKDRIGRWMVHRALGLADASLPADFGVALTPVTLEARLAALDAWAGAHAMRKGWTSSLRGATSGKARGSATGRTPR